MCIDSFDLLGNMKVFCHEFLVGWALFGLTQLVGSLVYKSIHWSPRNPIFKFAPEEFSNGTAFVHMAVEQDSELHFICPHPSLVLSRTSEDIPKSEMHENQWIVDKESFRSCDIETGNRNSTNKLNFECNSPATLKDDIQVFRSYGPSPKDVVFLAGKTYYFIATSNGSVESLKNTQGGHCRDPEEGISMRIEFYICKQNDPACNQTTEKIPPTTVVVTPSIDESVSGPRAPSNDDQTDFWKMLTGILGAVLGVALIIILILSCTYHSLRSKQRREQTNEMEYLNGPNSPSKA